MASRSSSSAPAIAHLLEGLESCRTALEQDGGASRSPEDSLKIGALAEEVKRLCRQSTESRNPREVARLLARARLRLDELQALLGKR